MNISEWSQELRRLLSEVKIGKITHDPVHKTIRLHIPPHRIAITDGWTPEEVSKLVKNYLARPTDVTDNQQQQKDRQS